MKTISGVKSSGMEPMRMDALTATAESAGASDYSTTNIQVEGVDEADIVKNDGKHIYVVSNNKVFIIDAYPAENAKKLSTIDIGKSISDIFINKDKLVIFGGDSMPQRVYEGGEIEDEVTGNEEIQETSIAIEPGYDRGYYYEEEGSYIKIYDISNRKTPKLDRSVSFDGNYFNSRMIGDYIYVIFNQYTNYYGNEPIPMPRVLEGEIIQETNATDIYYFEDVIRPQLFTRIVSVNTQNPSENFNSKVYLMDNAQEIHVSQNNIYLTYNSWGRNENTAIHKLSISNGQIEHRAQGSAPGRILNQFSMDEYDNHFRIATTSGNMWSDNNPSQNNVYILDENLELTGKVEGIAPGESIYSARFMGGRAYLVTFKRVDPLFTLDLSDHSNPKILGKLKIPGYSDYLHPYDENHLIGIGKEVDESIDADLVHSDNAVYYTAIQGVKLAIFDITDIENPKEMYKEVIGDRGSDSLASTDHRAFLFNREKNLLVVPILLAELNEGQPKSQEGDFTFQGAYVYDISLENGFQLKGRVGHASQDDLLKSGYNFYSNAEVLRSLYMDSTLYTISNTMIKANNLNTMNEISTILLE